ncbi:MAG: thiamine-phosphate kinase [Methanomassiliicoccales archaeon]
MNTLGSLGEREIVRHILEIINTIPPKGPGDDASAIDLGEFYLVLSTDMVSRKTHAPKGMTFWQLGWFLAAINYSDIAAMGAKPIGLLTSLGFPRETELVDMLEVIKGAKACSEYVGGEILGGDTKETSDITLAGTAVGIVGKKEILLRKGAKVGDILAVTGTLGLPAAGLHAIKNNLTCEKCKKALFEPMPRVREGLTLSSSGFVTSCIDISDGLAISLRHLSEASGVSFEVVWNKIPVDPAVKRIARLAKLDEKELVLYVGGDYQLLFTVTPKGWYHLKKRLGSAISQIGAVVDREKNTLVINGKRFEIEDRGYEHFK